MLYLKRNVFFTNQKVRPLNESLIIAVSLTFRILPNDTLVMSSLPAKDHHIHSQRVLIK